VLKNATKPTNILGMKELIKQLHKSGRVIKVTRVPIVQYLQYKLTSKSFPIYKCCDKRLLELSLKH